MPIQSVSLNVENCFHKFLLHLCLGNLLPVVLFAWLKVKWFTFQGKHLSPSTWYENFGANHLGEQESLETDLAEKNHHVLYSTGTVPVEKLMNQKGGRRC